MARFTFRFQSLLEHKQHLEEVTQVELAQVLARQQQEEGALQRLNRAENDAVGEMERQRFTGRLDVEALQVGLRFLDTIKTQIQRQEQIVTRAREQTAAKREQLVGFMQERQALEKLLERQRATFRLEQSRVEAREMDELVVMRHGHRQLTHRHNASGLR
jgi:flagellar export protein FliJ